MPKGLFYLSYLDGSTSCRRGCLVTSVCHMLYKKSCFNANSADTDETPRFAVSGQVLHGLPMSLICDARHKYVNILSGIVNTYST